jgi:hypothetical protein
MSDRDRTVFAAPEAAAGAALAVIGGLLPTVQALGAAVGTALLVLGVIALAQSVALGLGMGSRASYALVGALPRRRRLRPGRAASAPRSGTAATAVRP